MGGMGSGEGDCVAVDSSMGGGEVGVAGSTVARSFDDSSIPWASKVMTITVGMCSVGMGVGIGVSARLLQLESKLMIKINQNNSDNFEADMSTKRRQDIRVEE